MNKLLVFMNIMFIGAILLASLNIMLAGPARLSDIAVIALGIFGLFVGNYLAVRKTRR